MVLLSSSMASSPPSSSSSGSLISGIVSPSSLGLSVSPSSPAVLGLSRALRLRRFCRSVSALSLLRRTLRLPLPSLLPGLALSASPSPRRPCSMLAARSATSSPSLIGSILSPDSPLVAALGFSRDWSASSSPLPVLVRSPRSGIVWPLATRIWCLSFSLALRLRSR